MELGKLDWTPRPTLGKWVCSYCGKGGLATNSCCFKKWIKSGEWYCDLYPFMVALYITGFLFFLRWFLRS